MSVLPNPNAPSSDHNSKFLGSDEYQVSPRGRAIKSCLECRRRKMRCSRSQPCQNCSRFSRSCVYLPYPDWPQISRNNFLSQVSKKSESPPLKSLNVRAPRRVASQNPTTASGSDGELDPLASHDEFSDPEIDGRDLPCTLRIGRLIINKRLCGLLGPHSAGKVSRTPSWSFFLNEIALSVYDVDHQLTVCRL